MAVFRVNRNENYTHMANYHFKDKSLSWKAKGILSNMLSLPEKWDYSLAGLATLASDGMTATRSAIKELEEQGYLIRHPIRKDGKIADWEYIIFENPEASRMYRKPTLEIQDVENQQIENRTQLNTNQSNTKKSNTKDIKKESKKDSFNQIIADYVKKFTEPERSEIADLLGEWLKARKAKRAAMTDRAIQMNIDKLDTLASKSNMTVAEYLREIICRGWAAFYAINDYSKRNANGGKTYGENGIAISNEASELDDLF